MRNNRFKKFCALILAISLLIGSIPFTTVEAQEGSDANYLSDGSINYPGLATVSAVGNPNVTVELSKLVDAIGVEVPDNPESTSLDEQSEYVKATSSYSHSGDLRNDKQFTLDFGASKRVKASSIQMQARYKFGNRIWDGRVLASSDGSAWTEITSTRAQALQAMQTLEVKEDYKNTYYRFFKIVGGGNGGIFSLSELRIFGEYIELADCITELTVVSNNADVTTQAKAGDEITFTIVTSQPIMNTTVSILGTSKYDVDNMTTNIGIQAIDSSGVGTQWSATYMVDEFDFPGEIQFEVNYTDESGIPGTSRVESTDGSKVEIVDRSDYINLDNKSGVTYGISKKEADGSISIDFSTEEASKQAKLIMDQDVLSNSEIACDGGWKGFLVVDMGEGNSIALNRVNILARQRTDIYGRITGAYIQGSNNLSDWITLTNTAVNQMSWQTLVSKDELNTYRYIKIACDKQWYMNIAEIRFYGRCRNSGEAYYWQLKDAIDNATNIVNNGQKNYTDETWATLLQEIDNANAIIDSGSTNQDEIDQAASNLVLAIEALVEPLPSFIKVESVLNHPGVAQNEETLSRIRQHIINKEEPWYGYFLEFKSNDLAQKNYSIWNDKYPGTDVLEPNYGYGNYNTGFFGNQMTKDGQAAYYQALLYYFTGDVEYRENALRIIRLWSLLDPTEATYVADAHIHSGYPLFYFCSAAELLRYSTTFEEDLKWTDEDTDKFITNFLEPPLRIWLNKNDLYFNQQQFTTLATMAIFIFKDDLENYNKLVEWYTVNKSVQNDDEPISNSNTAYWNGAIVNAIYEFSVDNKGNVLENPLFAVKEMHRDQPHASLTPGTIAETANMLYAQGTKIDPVQGTVSTKDNAVGVYEFMNDRILKGTNYWYQYNLGYNPPFNDGVNSPLADGGRGRFINFSQIYYYYKYARGYSDTNEDMKYLAEGTKRYWDTYGCDKDERFIYIPEEAAGTLVPKANTVREDQNSSGPYQIENRYQDFDNNCITKTDEKNITYVRVQPSLEGAKIALLNNYRIRESKISLRLRTNNIITINLHRDANTDTIKTIYIPNTNGEWKNVTFDMSDVSYSKLGGDIQIYYMDIYGDEADYLDLDYYTANDTTVTAPVFENSHMGKEVNVCGGMNLSVSVKATDSNLNHTVTYSLQGDVPEGITVTSAGVLSWDIPSDESKKEAIIYVCATDGESISVLRIRLTIAGSFEELLQDITKEYNPDAVYETKTLEKYLSAYDMAVKMSSGTATGEEKNTAILELIEAVKNLRLLNPLLEDGSLNINGITTAVSGINQSTIPNLVDGDNTTGANDMWIVNDKCFILDFGSDFKVQLEKIDILGRNGFGNRAEGMVAFGSNDLVNWTPLTEMAPKADDWCSLGVFTEYQTVSYRYLKFKDMDGGVLNREDSTEDQPFNISELHLYGSRLESVNKVKNVTITSNDVLEHSGYGLRAAKASIGDTITLKFSAIEKLSNVSVIIAGKPVTTIYNGITDELHTYTASYVVEQDDLSGSVRFSIDYLCKDNVTQGDTVFFTTDSSSVSLSNDSDIIEDLQSKVTVKTSNSNGGFVTGSLGELLDNNFETSVEFKLDNNGWGAWLQLDFGGTQGDYAVQLSRIDLLGRAGFAGRVSGTYVQGSNDGVAWITLTEATAKENLQWQSLDIKSAEQTHAYRYVRIANGGQWFGNLSELRLYGKYDNNLVSTPVTTYTVSTKPSIEEGGTTIAYINKTGTYPPSTPTGSEAVLTGLAEGTSVTVVAKAKAGYKFVKWTESIVDDGLDIEYLWSYNPTFTLVKYDGGYLGGGKTYKVLKDWNMTAVFVKNGAINLEALKSAIQKAENLDLSKYQEKGKEEFAQALADAKLALENPDFTQEQYDSACENLINAMKALQKNSSNNNNSSSSGNSESNEDKENDKVTDYQISWLNDKSTVLVSLDNSYVNKLLTSSNQSSLELNIPIVNADMIENLRTTKSNTLNIEVRGCQQLINNADKFKSFSLVLPLEVQKLAQKDNKDIVVTVLNDSLKDSYVWRIDQANLAKTKNKLRDINLIISTSLASDTTQIKKAIQAKKINVTDGFVVTLNDEKVFSSQANIRVYVGDMSKLRDKKVYVYKYNSKLKKVETLPYSSKYKVDKDGYLELNVVSGGEYVVLPQAATAKERVALLEQISVSTSKKTLYYKEKANNKAQLNIKLPSTLEVTKSYKNKASQPVIGAVQVSYKSQNTKIATVDSSGCITAKSKGTAKILVTVKLYSGKEKTFTTTIKVK